MPKRLKNFINLIVLVSVTIGLVFSYTALSQGFVKPVQAGTSEKLPEGHDFATAVLGDPWDMSEFSDISQYLNRSGQANYLENIRVQDGVFSANAAGNDSAEFHPLFAGYNTALPVGRIGKNYPIDSSKYHCLYVAAKVDSGAPVNGVPDQMVIYWFADDRLNGGTWGQTLPGIWLYPEASSGTPAPSWKLFHLDLASADEYQTHWKDQSQWQGLRIDPTMQKTGFAVDWVRLTDCSPVVKKLTWNGSGSVSIYIRPEGTSRDILVESGVGGNSYNLDAQGIAAGTYTYFVKQNSQTLASGSFEITKSPVAQFTSPAPSEGLDYATQTGNAWDFSDTSDISSVKNASWSVNNGVLDLVTQSGTDPEVHLNVPAAFKSRDYRYLSFRMYTDYPTQNVPDGMVARLIWTIPSLTGKTGYECHLVSQDIPFDVGWHTYTVDLFDAFQGSVEQTSPSGPPHCPSLPTNWLSTSPVIGLRFDPNENILGVPLHQQIDWIRLTKEASVSKGGLFPVQIALDRSPDELKNVNFFYTTNPNLPTQNLAVTLPGSSTTQSSGSGSALSSIEANFRLYLPLSVSRYYTLNFQPITNGVNFAWDTSSVAPGEYYICALVEDDFNQATYCSTSPVQVAAP
jgi:hypothetical protein